MYLKSIKNFDNFFSAFHIENISTARSAVDILNKNEIKISISSFNLGIKNLKKIRILLEGGILLIENL